MYNNRRRKHLFLFNSLAYLVPESFWHRRDIFKEPEQVTLFIVLFDEFHNSNVVIE